MINKDKQATSNATSEDTEAKPRKIYTDLEIRTLNQEHIHNIISHCSEMRRELGYKCQTYEGLILSALRVYEDSLERRSRSKARKEAKKIKSKEGAVR